MQIIGLAILITLAIWAWPVTLICLGVWFLFLITQAIYRSQQKKTETIAVQSVATKERALLHDDWELLISTIVGSIKQHWDVLEDKFEQHIDEDDYGSKFIDDKYSKEIIYFSHKVVLPTLDKLIDGGDVKANSFALLPSPNAILEDLYNIKYEDSNTTMASKYTRGVLREDSNDPVSDDFLHFLYNKDSSVVSLENGSNNPSDKSSLLTLDMGGNLQASKPMKVTYLAGVVFSLFYVMYNSKPVASRLKQGALPVDFIGNNPYEYEEYVKKLLQARGFNVRRTRGSGDYGVDVIASRDGRSFAMQCKLYNRPVGTKAVQEIVSGRIFYRTEFAIVVSDNSFTPAAKNLARKSDVILTHHKNLLHQIESLMPSDIEEISQTVDSLPVGNKPSKDQRATAQTQWTEQDADELITVVIPTIINDGK